MSKSTTQEVVTPAIQETRKARRQEGDVIRVVALTMDGAHPVASLGNRCGQKGDREQERPPADLRC